MARIADLPLAGPVTGEETLPVVQDDTTKRLPLAEFLDETIAAVTAAALNARDETIAATEALKVTASASLTGSAITSNYGFVLDAPVLNGRPFTRARVVVEGTGSVELAFAVDGELATTPVLAAAGDQTFTISLTVPIGGLLRGVVGAITGEPTAVLIFLEGPPA